MTQSLFNILKFRLSSLLTTLSWLILAYALPGGQVYFSAPLCSALLCSGPFVYLWVHWQISSLSTLLPESLSQPRRSTFHFLPSYWSLCLYKSQTDTVLISLGRWWRDKYLQNMKPVMCHGNNNTRSCQHLALWGYRINNWIYKDTTSQNGFQQLFFSDEQCTFL